MKNVVKPFGVREYTVAEIPLLTKRLAEIELSIQSVKDAIILGRGSMDQSPFECAWSQGAGEEKLRIVVSMDVKLYNEWVEEKKRMSEKFLDILGRQRQSILLDLKRLFKEVK